MSPSVKKQCGSRSKAGFDVNPQNINKEGRPLKDWEWKEILLREVEKDSMKREGYKKKESMAVAQIEKAEEGDTSAFNAVLDRMDGKPVQETKTDLTSAGEKIDGFVVNFAGEPKAD